MTKNKTFADDLKEATGIELKVEPATKGEDFHKGEGGEFTIDDFGNRVRVKRELVTAVQDKEQK